MAEVALHGERGRNVDGEWELKPATLYLTVSDGGWVYLRKSTGVSAPTLLEIPLRDLLAAIAEVV